MSEEKKSLKKIRSGLFQRSYSLAKLTLNAGTQLAGNKLSGLLVNAEQKNENWTDFLKKQTFMISQELGQMKGSIMKAGQMLSLYGEYFLPPEANAALKTLYSDSPPLQWSEIEKILKQNFTEEQLSELEIDPISIGSASMGQVHKAKNKKTNEWMALKIQYPAIEEAINSDLKTLRILLKLMNFIPKGYNLDGLLHEIRDMMTQELNYRLEAEQTLLYAERLKNDTRYIVPKIFPQFCTDRIIATSFESGLSADHKAIQNLPQEERNQLASNYLELYTKEFYEWGIVQTDPNLGNYKIRLQPNGQHQLILLDFGAVRQYEKNFIEVYRKMILGALKNDDTQIEQATEELKFIGKNTSTKTRAEFVAFCKLTVEPFRGGIYDFKNSDLPPRLAKGIIKLIRTFELNSPPRDVFFLDRKTGGVFTFLVILGAKFDPQPILKKLVHF